MNKEPDETQQALEGFHARLWRARKDSGLTQQQLADTLDLSSQSTIAAWEKRTDPKRYPSLYYLTALCQALNVSADQMLGLQEPRSGGGIEWTVSMPRPDSFYHNPTLADGVELFTKIVKENNYTDPKGGNTAMLRHLLRNIFVTGVVRITDVERDDDLERQMMSAFPLKECIVAKLSIPSNSVIDASIRNEAVSFLAARDAAHSLKMVHSCGVVGGAVISRWVDLLPPAYGDVVWVSMVKTAGVEAPFGNTANALISRLAYTQGSNKALQMPFVDARRRRIEYLRKADKYRNQELGDAMDVLRQAQRVEVAFMSIGCSASYHQTQPEHPLAKVMQLMRKADQEKVVGDVLLRLIDKDGNPAGTEEDQIRNDAVIYSIDWNDLKKIAERGSVWILTGQTLKADCAKAALAGRLANSLVIDSSVARRLLENNDYSYGMVTLP